MKRVSVSAKKMSAFAGKWVVIDPTKDRIIAVASNLKEIGPLVSRPPSDKHLAGTVPFSYLVPRKGEGPYILWAKTR